MNSPSYSRPAQLCTVFSWKDFRQAPSCIWHFRILKGGCSAKRPEWLGADDDDSSVACRAMALCCRLRLSVYGIIVIGSISSCLQEGTCLTGLARPPRRRHGLCSSCGQCRCGKFTLDWRISISRFFFFFSTLLDDGVGNCGHCERTTVAVLCRKKWS